MSSKTHFSILLQKTVDVVTHTRWSNREVHTTEKVVLQCSSKKSSLPSGSQHKVDEDARSVDEHCSGLTSENIIEMYPLHMIDTQEDARDMEDLETSDKQLHVNIIHPSYFEASHCFTDTNGPMATLASKVSPPLAGDGGTHQGTQVFHLWQCNGGEMLQLHGWKLLLQGLLHSITWANTIPLEGPLDWCPLCPSIIVLTGVCATSWASW